MSEPLENRYRLLLAGFLDTDRAVVWRERLGDRLGDALGLIVYVLGRDVALPPDILDREHVATMLRALLPGRLDGSEPYAADLPDLLEDFLIHVADDAGVARQWEWTSAIDEQRAAFLAALQDPERQTFGGARHTPDRRPGQKLGRNEPCPCGSGRKYKQCCLRLL